MAHPVPEEKEEKKTLAQKILDALQQGEGALRDIVARDLKPGEVPSALDVERASRPRDTGPVQGFFGQVENIGEIGARGRVGQHELQQEQTAAESLIALQQAQGENLRSLASTRVSRLDIARERNRIKSAENVGQLDQQAQELKEKTRQNDLEAQEAKNQLDFDKIKQEQDQIVALLRENSEARKALAAQQNVDQQGQLIPSEIGLNKARSVQFIGAGAESQAQAGAIPGRLAVDERLAAVQERLATLRETIDPGRLEVLVGQLEVNRADQLTRQQLADSLVALRDTLGIRNLAEAHAVGNEVLLQHLLTTSQVMRNFGIEIDITDPNWLEKAISGLTGGEARTPVDTSVRQALTDVTGATAVNPDTGGGVTPTPSGPVRVRVTLPDGTVQTGTMDRAEAESRDDTEIIE